MVAVVVVVDQVIVVVALRFQILVLLASAAQVIQALRFDRRAGRHAMSQLTPAQLALIDANRQKALQIKESREARARGEHQRPDGHGLSCDQLAVINRNRDEAIRRRAQRRCEAPSGESPVTDAELDELLQAGVEVIMGGACSGGGVPRPPLFKEEPSVPTTPFVFDDSVDVTSVGVARLKGFLDAPEPLSVPARWWDGHRSSGSGPADGGRDADVSGGDSDSMPGLVDTISVKERGEP